MVGILHVHRFVLVWSSERSSTRLNSVWPKIRQVLGIRRTHTLRDQRRQQLTQAPMTNHQSAAGHLNTHINTQW